MLLAFIPVQTAAAIHKESFLLGLLRLISISPQRNFANDPCFFPGHLSKSTTVQMAPLGVSLWSTLKITIEIHMGGSFVHLVGKADGWNAIFGA